MKDLRINTSELKHYNNKLEAGQRILLSGEVYTARDAAHVRLIDLIENDSPLPFKLEGSCIYYAGPTPAPKGMVIGSCGPTTSGRMDAFTPTLIKNGLLGMIGKGERSEDVCKAIMDFGAVYLCAIGGAGALAAKCVTACDEIAFPELGCESVKRLVFKDFPLIVGIDCNGGNLFCRNNS
jgi:fumarate hydratase subunit beta